MRAAGRRGARSRGYAKTPPWHILITAARIVARRADGCDDRPRVHPRPSSRSRARPPDHAAPSGGVRLQRGENTAAVGAAEGVDAAVGASRGGRF